MIVLYLEMEGIYETNDTFDFNKLALLSPTNTPGGNYFIKFRMNDSPLYIQPPKCKTKQGVLKSNKKYYCDLLFTNENEKFIHWMERLENHCRKIIFENRDKWFDIELDEHDIESSFTSPLKLFKSGKFYLARCNVSTTMGICSLKLYNETEEEIALETLKENSDILTVLEIQGIKCSTKNFQIEIEIKQMMVIEPKKMFEKCIFKGNSEGGKPLEESLEMIPSNSSLPDEDQMLSKVHVVSEEMNTSSSLSLPSATLFSNDSASSEGEGSIVIPKTQGFVEEELGNPCEPMIIEDNNHPFRDQSLKANQVPMIPPQAKQGAPLFSQTNPPSSIKEEPQFLSNDSAGGSIIYSNNSARGSIVLPKMKKEELPSDTDIFEFDVDLDKMNDLDVVKIKKRNEIYFELYREAKRKAKIARDLALSSYLEAKHIKNTYLLEDFAESDSDLDDDFFTNIHEQ